MINGDGFVNIGLFLVVAAVAFAILLGIMRLAHFLLTMPMRRAERARLFLDLIEGAINDGRPVEETLVSISKSQEPAVGVRFHAFAAWLENGVSFNEALAKVPGLVPPQIRAMLQTGAQLGDLRKVMPACRQLLKDAAVETQSAAPYLFLFTLFSTPLGFWIYVKVIPKFREIMWAMEVRPASTNFVLTHGALWLDAQLAMLGLLVVAAFFYLGGPGTARWFPLAQEFQYLKPWRRKRMQRDFSTMLGILLDSEVPESEAVRLAADCTVNRVFRRGANGVIARLEQGVKLPEAIAGMDASGEFGWRLRNAFFARGHFFRALAGWNESLDAQAYQQKQAASTWITTGLVFWNGVFVGSLVISIFSVLITIIDAGTIW